MQQQPSYDGIKQQETREGVLEPVSNTAHVFFKAIRNISS